MSVALRHVSSIYVHIFGTVHIDFILSMLCYLAQSRDQIEQDEEDRGEAERLRRADGDQEDAVTGDSEEHQDLQTA